MRYIEHIKSIALLFLVTLSLVLTFLIWTHTPKLQIIEEKQVERVMVGKQKDLQYVIKPYRILVRDQNEWSGTVGSAVINDLTELMTSWKGTNLQFVQNNMSNQKINDFLRNNNRMTLFYPEEIPMKVFHAILPLSQDEIPELTFNRMIIDWNKLKTNHVITLYFLSEKNRTLFSTEVNMSESYFNTSILETLDRLIDYEEVKIQNLLSLYVPTEKIELIQFTYYIDEIQPDTFKDILFYDPAIVRKNVESSGSLKYTDGMTLMTVDTNLRNLNYVNPSAESLASITASRLLFESYDFINDHGGFTGDYRLISMNLQKHITEYQLYKQGYPVFSNDKSTRIITTWGENQLFRYKRPYYLLDMDISSEKSPREVATGTEVVEFIKKTKQLELEEIDDIILGYYLKQNDNNLLFTLEPSWFAVVQGSWIRITPEVLGGGNNGLE